ncbi:MAG: hypothetical protein ACE15F_22970 [bacterium]
MKNAAVGYRPRPGMEGKTTSRMHQKEYLIDMIELSIIEKTNFLTFNIPSSASVPGGQAMRMELEIQGR